MMKSTNRARSCSRSCVVLLENDDSEKDHEFGEVTDDDDDDRCMIISSYLFSDVCVVFVYDT
jgi:hypothetical protein